MTKDKYVSSRETWQAWDELYRRQPRTWKGPADDVAFETASGILLELGCGSGKTLRSLGAVCEAIAIDVSRSAITACRMNGLPDNVHLVQGDAMRLPFADATVDVVVAHHILGHLIAREREEAAKEIARVLRQNRLLSIRVMSSDDMRSGTGKEVEPMTFSKGGVICHFFDESEIGQLFPSFEIIKIETTSIARRYDGMDRKRSEIVALLRSV